jgi:polyribonucleotide nucleotidyltransferase
VLPSKEEFPYTIRVVSEVLGSNGSSSMGSVCGSTLALMDGGVPIKKPVAGIAMGLASRADGRYKIITDLQDLEDGEGGMDFKIAGTKDGITAIQLDTKTSGLAMAIVNETFSRALQARLKILEVMGKAIPSPRAELSPYAPRIISFKIDPLKIGLVIGTGGKTINEIIAKTGVQIDIEPDGTVLITSTSPEKAIEARTTVETLTREIKIGEEFTGKVFRIEDFGAFVELIPGKDGLVHVSMLSDGYVRSIHDVVKIGDELKVRVNEIDDKNRINLCVVGVKNCGQSVSSRPERPRGAYPSGSYDSSRPRHASPFRPNSRRP